jgi:hypothetical protein
MNDDIRRTRTAFIWVGVVVPLVILAAATAVIAAWLPELPDPVATHWGSEGVDGFSPPWMYIVLTLGFGGGLVLVLGLLAMFAHRLPQSSTKPQLGPWGPTTRFLAGTNLGLSLLIATIGLAGTGIQRGLADAADAPGIGGWTLLGLGLLIAGAGVGWFLQPANPAYPAVEADSAATIPLASSERAAWFGTAVMTRTGIVFLSVALAVLALLTVFFAVRGEPSWWILAATTLLIAVLMAAMLVFRVRVNANGLRVRSLIGWPNTRIPLERIERVETVQIDPMREFGGWGWRLGLDGRRGVVLRAGDALQVTHSGGRVFVVTIDGAAEAAAVLETLRAHSA